MGTQESFIAAALIPLLGCNVMTMRLYPLIFSMIFVWVTYLLARKTHGPAAGLIVLALLAIPAPYLTMCGALVPPDNYLAMTTLGSISLLLLMDLAFGTPAQKPWWKFVLLGLVLGYTFWLHIFVISYMGVALLFLFLRDKRLFLRGDFWAGVFAFCVGSLPLLWYNATRDFAMFSEFGRTADWARAWDLVKELFGITLHFLIGLKVMLYGDNTHFISLPVWLAFLLALIWIGALLLAFMPRTKSRPGTASLPAKGSSGAALLLTLVAASAFMFCRNARAEWNDVRYILPMMSALPILLAAGLARVREWSRPVFTGLLMIVIGAQVWGNVLLVRAWNNPRIIGEELELPATSRLLTFLAERGIRHGYAHYGLARRLIFEAREQFICVPPSGARASGREAQFTDQVRAATNAAYIDHLTLRLPGNFEANLKAIGGTYQKAEGYHFKVYYDFTPPYGRQTLREIPRTAWRATAGRNPQAAGNAIDNNPTTSWGTGRPQTAGTCFQLDLGRLETVCQIRFDLGERLNTYPRGCRIDVSTDGKLWQQVLVLDHLDRNFLFWEGSHPQWLFQGNFFTAAFLPVNTRYVRLTLTASDPDNDWAIAELRLFTPQS